MTARPGGAPPHPRSRALGLLVLALHLAGGLALHRLVRPPAPAPIAPTPVHVWISLAPPPPPPAPPRRAAHEAAPPRPAAAPIPPLPRPGPAEPQAITLPAAAAAAAVDGPAPPGTAAAPAPLNLALPARPASSPPPAAWTRNDPRVHDAPLDGEQRMARTLGTDTRLRSVSRGDGFELRRGNDCVNVQPSRAGQIFMPDGGARPPSQVGKC